MAPFELSSNVVAIGEPSLHAWTAEIVRRVGTPDDIAAGCRRRPVAADLRGVSSHGTFRLPVSTPPSRRPPSSPRLRAPRATAERWCCAGGTRRMAGVRTPAVS